MKQKLRQTIRRVFKMSKFTIFMCCLHEYQAINKFFLKFAYHYTFGDSSTEIRIRERT